MRHRARQQGQRVVVLVALMARLPPLDAEAARDLAVHLIAAGQAAAEVPGAAGGPA